MKEEIPPLGEVFELMRLIWSVNRGLELSSRRMQSRLGISGPQRLALRIIGRFPRITAAQLTLILHIDRSTTSTLLSGLAGKRLISRQVDRTDKRRILLTLTDKGRTLDVPAPGTVEASVTRLLHDVSRAELEYGGRFLKKLSDALAGDHPAANEGASS